MAPRRASHPPEPRRRWRWSPVAIVLSLGLLGSTAGFATGARRPPAREAPAPMVVDSGRAAYTRAVDGAVQELAARRESGVAAMRAARTSGREQRAAERLANDYRAARDAVAHAPNAPARSALADRLGDAARAYRRVALAAGAHDARAFRAARVAVARSERAIAHALVPLSR